MVKGNIWSDNDHEEGSLLNGNDAIREGDITRNPEVLCRTWREDREDERAIWLDRPCELVTLSTFSVDIENEIQSLIGIHTLLRQGIGTSGIRIFKVLPSERGVCFSYHARLLAGRVAGYYIRAFLSLRLLFPFSFVFALPDTTSRIFCHLPLGLFILSSKLWGLGRKTFSIAAKCAFLGFSCLSNFPRGTFC